ncbi:cobalamin-5'-phosphate synthase [Salinihabitans flavidus]|uniref:Adenosylcobinamide-GDP ribazoletransferase n=1 Tax=Salinihabitans flavidus TaxID=569882 RepID=A0A1H8T8B5_9RHOB|nr:adenosylcobinamide-GDP ribazoletransferase [Salinihabitans flavidus]SEO86723.1 cobalamin-5'-phosphate synthase [Salinihabitans flavidus]
MFSDDTSAAVRPGDILTALALLTRLPVRADFSRGARAGWAYPLAGAVLAGLAALPTGAALALGLPSELAALLFIATVVILSGAMHEDGLSDAADGLWGGWDRARRLEIMKDSRIGAYGVIALCLALAARWMAVGAVLAGDDWLGPLIAVAMLSRAAMPALMAALPHARDSGLSHAQGRADRGTALIAAALAGLAALMLAGGTGVSLIIATLLITAACGSIARVKIGGQTGDILGATQQIAEIALLLILAAQ